MVEGQLEAGEQKFVGGRDAPVAPDACPVRDGFASLLDLLGGAGAAA